MHPVLASSNSSAQIYDYSREKIIVSERVDAIGRSRLVVAGRYRVSFSHRSLRWSGVERERFKRRRKENHRLDDVHRFVHVVGGVRSVYDRESERTSAVFRGHEQRGQK